jgi:hypothetical protein
LHDSMKIAGIASDPIPDGLEYCSETGTRSVPVGGGFLIVSAPIQGDVQCGQTLKNGVCITCVAQIPKATRGVSNGLAGGREVLLACRQFLLLWCV